MFFAPGFPFTPWNPFLACTVAPKDGTGVKSKAYFTEAKSIPLRLAPEADPKGEHNQANVKPK